MKQLQLNQKVKQNVLNCRIIKISKLILQCNLIFESVGYLKLLNYDKKYIKIFTCISILY